MSNLQLDLLVPVSPCVNCSSLTGLHCHKEAMVTVTPSGNFCMTKDLQGTFFKKEKHFFLKYSRSLDVKIDVYLM